LVLDASETELEAVWLAGDPTRFAVAAPPGVPALVGDRAAPRTLAPSLGNRSTPVNAAALHWELHFAAISSDANMSIDARLVPAARTTAEEMK
jgi:hypothetical protein